MTGDQHFVPNEGSFSISVRQTDAKLIRECAADGGGNCRTIERERDMWNMMDVLLSLMSEYI
jgi:hypothetical protein